MDSLGLNHAPANVKSYLWSFPGCPVPIHINFDLIERIRKEIVALAPEGCEVGGLLTGSTSPHSADVQVSDYFLVAPRSGGGPPAPAAAAPTAQPGQAAQPAPTVQYVICEEGLAHALAI